MVDMIAHLTKSLRLRFFSLHCYDDQIPKRRVLMQKVLKLLIGGSVVTAIDSKFALADVRRAHEKLDSRQVLAKILLLPDRIAPQAQ